MPTGTLERIESFINLENLKSNNDIITADFSQNISLTIYPNPVQNVLTISSEVPVEEIEVYSIIGQLVVKTKNTQIDVSYLSSGLYFSHISLNGQTIVKKFVKS